MPGERTFALLPVERASLPLLAQFARPIWEEWFTPLLGAAQVAYMLDRFQSPRALARQVEREGYRYFFITDGGEAAGYTGVCPDPGGGLFLSKLYLTRSARGRGLARKAFAALCACAREQGLPYIRLTVNRHNTQAIAVYAHLGFQRTGAAVTDIGGGFVMDDYLYEYRLGERPRA